MEATVFDESTVAILGLDACKRIADRIENLQFQTSHFGISAVLSCVGETPLPADVKNAAIGLVNTLVGGIYEHVGHGRYVANGHYSTIRNNNRPIHTNRATRIAAMGTEEREDFETMMRQWRRAASQNGVPVRSPNQPSKPVNSRHR